MQFPFITVPDGSNVLHLRDFREVYVRASLILAEDKVREMLFEVRAFAESDRLFSGSCLNPSALNVTVERGRSLPCLR